jgi:hypothetical protein
MMEHLQHSDELLGDGENSLVTYDNLDVDFEGGGFEMESGDIDEMLKEETHSFDPDDSLASMPIFELDEEEADAAIGHLIKESNQTQRAGEALNIQGQGSDPLLGTLAGGMMQPEHNQMTMQNSHDSMDSCQLMDNEEIQNGDHDPEDNRNSSMFAPMNHPSQMGVVDLEAEKMKLLNRLSEINNRQQQQNTVEININTRQQQQNTMSGMSGMSGMSASAMQTPQNNNMFFQQNQNNNMFLQSNDKTFSQQNQNNNLLFPQNNNMNMFTQQKKMQHLVSSVASVGEMGEGGGETPLARFLRASKSQQSQPQSQPQTLPSQNVSGMPNAASIFSEMPMGDQEAINSQSELMSSKSFLQKTNSRGQLLASMDRSTASQEMVKNLSARNMLREGLSRQGSGRNLAGGGTKNATWGTDGTRKPSYRTSGILPKHASENHLMRQGSLSKSKSKLGSASRENSLYNLMKRNSSKNLLQREDSLSQLLPKRRSAGVSKHKLGMSRSVPHMMLSNSNKGGSSTNGYQKNAMW